MSRPAKRASEDKPMLLKVPEVCYLLNRSRSRVYEMIYMGELEHFRDGKSILVPREAVEDWVRLKRALKSRTQ
ncbi:MAG: helix-turn-helix domain-containing protein [Armatimonadetes bacterium]|nr:helix-turn-helix domain-containing protein [Armatimonadota bacterium]